MINPMQIAVTGATGFLGRYIVNHLLREGHTCRCWYRPTSDRGGFDHAGNRLEWLPGELSDPKTVEPLMHGVDAVVHAALDRPGAGFRGAEGLPVPSSHRFGNRREISAADAPADSNHLLGLAGRVHLALCVDIHAGVANRRDDK